MTFTAESKRETPISMRRKVLLLTGEKASHRELVRDAIDLYDDVLIFSGPVSVDFIRENKIWAIVSDRNGHILTSEVINELEGRAYNSHPSLLPLHRGWQPIFFSVCHNTPVGVSIHQIDSNIDCGGIVFQSEVKLLPNDRLDTLHFRCRLEILKGWVEVWPLLRTGELKPRAQPGRGSFHSRDEFENLFMNFPMGWKTSLNDVRTKFLALSS